MIFMKLLMLQDNCILGLVTKIVIKVVCHRLRHPWYQNFLDMSRAFQKTARVADMCFYIHVITAKQLKHTKSVIFLHFDTICS